MSYRNENSPFIEQNYSVIVNSQLRQELKQDISSFRYEVIGMMKGNRKSTHGKTPGTDASCASHSDCSLQYSSSLQHSSKINLCDVTTVLQQDTRASLSSLANGSVALVDTTLKDKAKKDFPKDFSDFGLFQKTPKQSDLFLNQNKIYSLAEEVREVDSDISDWMGEEPVEKTLAGEVEKNENESKYLTEDDEKVLEDHEREHLESPQKTLDELQNEDYVNHKSGGFRD